MICITAYQWLAISESLPFLCAFYPVQLLSCRVLLPFLLLSHFSCIQDLTWIKPLLAKIRQAKFKEGGASLFRCIKQACAHFVRALEKTYAFAARNLGVFASPFQHQEPKHFLGRFKVSVVCVCCPLKLARSTEMWELVPEVNLHAKCLCLWNS